MLDELLLNRVANIINTGINSGFCLTQPSTQPPTDYYNDMAQPHTDYYNDMDLVDILVIPTDLQRVTTTIDTCLYSAVVTSRCGMCWPNTYCYQCRVNICRAWLFSMAVFR